MTVVPWTPPASSPGLTRPSSSTRLSASSTSRLFTVPTTSAPLLAMTLPSLQHPLATSSHHKPLFAVVLAPVLCPELNPFPIPFPCSPTPAPSSVSAPILLTVPLPLPVLQAYAGYPSPPQCNFYEIPSHIVPSTRYSIVKLVSVAVITPHSSGTLVYLKNCASPAVYI